MEYSYCKHLSELNFCLICYETRKLLASLLYQQMHFLTIDLKGNGVELLITFVTLIVNKKVIPCLCHFNCLELFQIVMRLEISWLVYHIKCWLVKIISTNVFLLIDWQEHEYQSTWFLWKFILCTQCPRTDLNKRFLPRANATTAWKLTDHTSNFSKN